MKKLLLTLFLAGLSVLGAGTVNVTITDTMYLADNELKPGDYKVKQKDGKVFFTQGKTTVEAAVKAEPAGKKFLWTEVSFVTIDGKRHISEIRLSGTDTRLVLH